MTMTSLFDFHKIKITDTFFGDYQRLTREVVIPYQWDAINDRITDAEPSHALRNFRIAAGLEEGEFYGMVFQDSDVTKWLEAVAWSLSQYPDAALEATADAVIDLLEQAQWEDGYLNTWYTVKEPGQRWTNLAENHELYCAGHLFEAAVAYYLVTGKQKIIDISCRFADHIDSVFGRNSGQIKGYPGHPEIELALLKLYEVTANRRYLDLATYFIDERGTTPHFYESEYEKRGFTWRSVTNGPGWMFKDKAYSQAHAPLKEQQEATGHAVRFAYLLTGAAHLAHLKQDDARYQVCRRLWDSMVQRQMYITGGIGSQARGEAFSCNYDLPSDTAYTETCASIAVMMFARRMLECEGDAEYADVMERALYNTVLGGMSLDGRHFFYVNPLETAPVAIRHNHKYEHVKPVRQRWFGCACCPPNIARTLSGIGQYIYTVHPETLFINLFVGNTWTHQIDGQPLTLTLEGHYPTQDKIAITVDCPKEITHTLAVRIPGWCDNAVVKVNGDPVNHEPIKGYLHLHRCWKAGDIIEMQLPMSVRPVYAHPQVRQLAGKVALQRGPLVYCLEEADNGCDLHNLWLDERLPFTLIPGTGLMQGKTLIQASGVRLRALSDGTGSLYRFDQPATEGESVALTFIPWYAWANRGEGEMRIWVNSQRYQ